MNSGLFGIQKVMKLLQEEADDIVEYTETMNEINAAINGADGSAYMAIFVSSSSSSTPPQKYFDDAKIEVKRAVLSMKDLDGIRMSYLSACRITAIDTSKGNGTNGTVNSIRTRSRQTLIFVAIPRNS